MSAKDPLAACTGFDWNKANSTKNWDHHAVTPEEAEDVFFHDPLIVRSDPRPSKREKRYWALVQTGRGRKLFVAFTVRGKLIRVISVRDMSQREKRRTRAMKKEIPEFKSEAEEFEFWSSSGAGADSAELIDWSAAKRTKLPNLKPTLRTISVRLPVAMIEDLKILANKRDVPYQSLLKVFLAERLEKERGMRRMG
jgi:uncharacterized DUF497 family protein